MNTTSAASFCVWPFEEIEKDAMGQNMELVVSFGNGAIE
jgi:hypothetical protein